jgi:polysaccharide export outer membrane protein
MLLPPRKTLRLGKLPVLWALCAAGVGCATYPTSETPAPVAIPRELQKTTMPPYTIEPPDTLEIDTLSLVPKPPYHIAPLDFLLIHSTASLSATEAIDGTYSVDPEGRVSLGVSYGSVQVAGMTLSEARDAVEAQVRQFLPKAQITLSLAQSRAMQVIRGEHLVGQDGTVNLGVYGTVYVAGLTVPEAKAALERHLSQYVSNPEISLLVTGYNSKVYYVVFDGAGYGKTITRLPITGNETVLDALAQLNGLPSMSSVHRVWLARPAPPGQGCDEVLPVDLDAITGCASTATNYQLLPGDRIHVESDRLIALNNWVQKLLAPVEQIFGVTLLGTETIHAIKTVNQGAGTGTATGTGTGL